MPNTNGLSASARPWQRDRHHWRIGKFRWSERCFRLVGIESKIFIHTSPVRSARSIKPVSARSSPENIVPAFRLPVKSSLRTSLPHIRTKMMPSDHSRRAIRFTRCRPYGQETISASRQLKSGERPRPGDPMTGEKPWTRARPFAPARTPSVHGPIRSRVRDARRRCVSQIQPGLAHFDLATPGTEYRGLTHLQHR